MAVDDDTSQAHADVVGKLTASMKGAVRVTVQRYELPRRISGTK
jgi:hypothetical protein